MEKLVILGKGPRSISLKQIKSQGYKIWTVGTFDDPEDCLVDRFYEWHGLHYKNRNMHREYPEYLKKSVLPLNNSICNMLLIAYHEGYKDVVILGAPMELTEEYRVEKPALIYCIGYLNALGMNISYDQIPKSKRYGENSEKRLLAKE